MADMSIAADIFALASSSARHHDKSIRSCNDHLLSYDIVPPTIDRQHHLTSVKLLKKFLFIHICFYHHTVTIEELELFALRIDALSRRVAVKTFDIDTATLRQPRFHEYCITTIAVERRSDDDERCKVGQYPLACSISAIDQELLHAASTCWQSCVGFRGAHAGAHVHAMYDGLFTISVIIFTYFYMSMPCHLLILFNNKLA